MSKAFDTVNRCKLFKHLEEIHNPDELHLLSIITNYIKVNGTYGKLFQKLISMMQGTVSVHFSLYFTCLKSKEDGIEQSILITVRAC